MENIPNTNRNGLTAGGSILVDYIVIIDCWPRENCTTFIQRQPTIVGGGGPYNIAKTLTAMKADIPISLIGLLGNDANGKWLVDDCLKSNIDINQLQFTNDSTPTSFTYVMSVENTTQRTFFHHQGTNALLNTNHFDFSKTTAKLFYLGVLTQLSQLDQFLDHSERTHASRVLESAIMSGLQTIVDLSSTPISNYSKVARSSLPFIDDLIINETEAGYIVGRTLSIDHINEIRQAAEELINAGVRNTVTIHFERGALSMTKDHEFLTQGAVILPPGWIKCAVGAGDAFAAAMVYGIHEQWPLDKTLHLAVCVGAMSLNDETACGAMKTIAQCLKLEKFGFRTL